MGPGRGTGLKRGEIYWVDFDPIRGGEIGKRRPAVVVSNDTACAIQNRLQVVPITTNTRRVHSWEAPVEVRGLPCKALADQIRTVAKERVLDFVGEVTVRELRGIERAIKLQLGLI
ncbi:MAG: type II toxin-antitoxin system PemK/MazF family toxin [Chloroflexota bacterium]